MPLTPDDACGEFTAALKKARRVLVATHVNPDGDAVGSAAAFAHLAQHCGAQARLLLMAGLPDFLAWLPLPVPVVRMLGELDGWVPDLLILADCGDAGRAGPELASMLDGRAARPSDWELTVTANIDHHVSNKGYADINWVEPEASATGELAGLLAERLGVRLDGALGQALYLALASDTGNFTYSNTGARCLGLASRIVEAGLDIASFTDNYENTWSLDRMYLWGRLLSEITLHAEGAVASAVVRRAWLDERGLGNDALEGFASWLRRIRGVRVGVFVREDAPGLSKISLRSMGDIDVQAVCALFGGGGHAAAAGAEVAMPPEEAAAAVVAEIEKRMR